MSQKKVVNTRLQNTLNELDSAIEQWDSITNKPPGEQVSGDCLLQKRAKSLLRELRDQIEEFETIPEVQAQEDRTNQ